MKLHCPQLFREVNRKFRLDRLLAAIPDSRSRPHYRGEQLLTALLLGFVMGLPSLLRLEGEFALNPWLRTITGLRFGQTPVADTLVNYADTVDFAGLHHVLRAFWQTVATLNSLEPLWVAFDGSSLCQFRQKPIAPLYGVAVWVITGPFQGLLAFLRRKGKEGHGTGELTAAGDLLESLLQEFRFLPLRGVVVDALYCNRPFFQKCWQAKKAFICRLAKEELHLFRDAQGLFRKGLGGPWHSRRLHVGSRWYHWEWREAEGLEAFHPNDPQVRVIHLRQTPQSKAGLPLGKLTELWLVTSLTAREMSGERVLELMRARWEIETGFRTLKHAFHLETLAPTRPYACAVFWVLAGLAALLLEWWFFQHKLATLAQNIPWEILLTALRISGEVNRSVPVASG